MVVDDALVAEAVPTRRRLAHLADCPVVVPETGPVPPADFPHPQGPCTTRSTNPPEYYIRRGSENRRSPPVGQPGRWTTTRRYR